MKDDTISRAAAIDAMMKLQAEDIEAYGASIPEGFDGDRAVTAIKALPSATDTNVGGNLSVDELITFLNPESNYVFYDDSHGFCINTQDVLDHLCVMPSAQPETAKRIVGKSRDGMTLWYQCDMCNEPVDAKDNYCRGCGRRLTDG